MKKVFYFLILLVQFNKISGQTATTITPSKATHALGLSVGLSHTALKLETVSPYIFTGFATPLQLSYRRENTVSRQSVEVAYQGQTLKSPLGFKIVELGGHLSYSYLRKVKNFNKMNLFLGGELRFSGANRSMPQGLNNTSNVILSSLNVSSLANYAIGKHQFDAQLSLAVLGYNLRPYDNFKGNFTDSFFDNLATNARWETPPQYVNTFWRLGYLVPTTARHFGWRFDYLGNYCGFQQRQFLGTLTHQLTTSFVYQF
jgi:hypothetical protein